LPTPPATVCPVDGGGNLGLHQPGVVSNSQWPSWGGDLHNTHHAATESMISPENVAQLELKWSFQTLGSVSANPTVEGDNLYFPDWGRKLGDLPHYRGGNLYSLNRWTGVPNWQKSVNSYNNNKFNNISRSSPVIAGDLLIIGDVQNAVPMVADGSLTNTKQRRLRGMGDPCGGYVYAIHKDSGEMVWKRRIGENFFDQVTQSPIVFGNKVLVGVSSQESAYAKEASLPCCSFQGSFVALDLHTGELLWRKYMTAHGSDPADRFSGASVWAGAPTVDVVRNSVYVPTGNNYSVPASYKQCVKDAGTDVQALEQCAALWQDNHFDSIVSLNLDDGSINWVMNSLNYDAWNAACDRDILIPLLPGSDKNCPDPKGPDADFAQPPMLITVMVNGQPEDRLYAGTKGGVFFAINPDDGSVIWQHQVGPGGPIGGMQFGAATDGQRIYIQNTNFLHEPYQLEEGLRKGETIRGGFWAALDPVNGAILWQTPVPTVDLPFDSNCEPELVGIWGTSVCLHPVQGVNKGPAFWAWPIAPLTVANGVVFAGVADLDGTMVAMDASSGEILWQFLAGASIGSAPTVVDGRVYWGVGYKYGIEGNQLFSFGLPGDTR
jgi:polyvinyl alcohol dehydrogenase (cytochrome)